MGLRLSAPSGPDPSNPVQTDSATLGSGTTTDNSLKITTTLNGQSLTIGSGNTLALTSGGLLFTGANNYSISGGTLQSMTATNSDLIVHQYGSGTLTIGSVISTGNGTSTLTKTGPGTLVLTGVNGYTGNTFVNAGTLSLGVARRLAGTVTVNGTANFTETVANALSGTAALTVNSSTPVTLAQSNS